jgi:N-acyl-D-aspartate/D-glutamate deacylase
VREAVMGSEDRVPTQTELEQMKTLVVRAMKDGALGLSTALIYAPGHFAKAKELIALAKVAAQYGGIYATHLRSEGATEMAAIDEALGIGREAGLPVEIFHLKVSEYYADLAIFDPATISDQATYTNPTQLSQGVDYVFVNGQLEYDYSSSTGVKAGRPLRGAGWEGTTAQ